ncbi:ATP synthase F1 subunit delta [Thermomicrobium sp. CFH 73360]|uniref:ATP synthase F1 subunit delta n=1 Tax=Thermomicrobium sp. CFH 73360 TaxID=2951987 RepID=UPI0020769DE8|nr:ATP synthase F1 subunit delta [Thermomicrobium sp. CFH 73360]
MAVAGVAKRYAQAAFAVAKEHGQLTHWEQRLLDLIRVAEDTDLEEFVENPAIPLEAKVQVIERLFPDEDDRYLRSLLVLLLERGRWHQLRDVAEAFQQLLREERGVLDVELVTAVSLEEAEIERVRQQLETRLGRPVQLRTSVDPELLGGVVLRIGDEVFDASVRTQLTGLRRQLIGAAA